MCFVCVLQKSFVEAADSLVSINLLVVSAVSAFATGAALSGLLVCWIMGCRQRRRSRGSRGGSGGRRRGDKEPGGGGSVMSVSRPVSSDRPRLQAETFFMMPNGWVEAGDLDAGLLPTPEQTPQQQKRPPPGLRLTDSGWDQSQTLLCSAGTPCPLTSSSIYLSSKLLQGGGGRHEDPGGPTLSAERQHFLAQRGGAAVLRNSAVEYRYPLTPQGSPDRRRVVSAPSAQLDFGDALRWTHGGFGFDGSRGTPSGQPHPGTHPYPNLARGLRGYSDVADLGRLLGGLAGDRTQTSQ
ncbi:semaphorin-6B-like [Arapaima gigas]